VPDKKLLETMKALLGARNIFDTKDKQKYLCAQCSDVTKRIKAVFKEMLTCSYWLEDFIRNKEDSLIKSSKTGKHKLMYWQNICVFYYRENQRIQLASQHPGQLEDEQPRSIQPADDAPEVENAEEAKGTDPSPEQKNPD
jgi:hypothetical protein